MDEKATTAATVEALAVPLIGGIGFLILAYASVLFTWHGSLASLADDSVSYLVAAQVFSPYFDVSAPVRAIFPSETSYPPAFSLLMALTGASHSLYAAHMVVVVCFLASVVALYFLGKSDANKRTMGACLCLVFVLLPAPWMNLLGILSENLYLLISIICLIVFNRHPDRSKPSYAFLALVGLLIATRITGITLLLAYLVTSVVTYRRQRDVLVRHVLTASIALVPIVIWIIVRPSATTDAYLQISSNFLAQLFSSPLGAVTDMLGAQWGALRDAWMTSLISNWIPKLSPSVVVSVGFGVLALAGLAIRLAQNRLDAWYVLLYLGLYVAWPFPGQMLRFLYPVVPLMLFHALWVVSWAVGRWISPRVEPRAIVYGSLILLSVSIPSLFFIYGRTTVADRPYVGITEFYREPGLKRAAERARVQLDILGDMSRVRESTPANAVVAWYVPSYVALLADRTAVRLDADPRVGQLDRLLKEEKVTHIYLSRFHPRSTVDSSQLDKWLQLLMGTASIEPLWVRTQPNTQQVESVLLSVRR